MSEGRKAPRERNNPSPLARARLAAGMTQQELAEAVGILQKDVSRYERGAVKPSAVILSKLARAIGCTMEELL